MGKEALVAFYATRHRDITKADRQSNQQGSNATGAADDRMSSCAVMLELASVLASASAKLERDVLLLFADAEEEDSIGSYQFYFGHQSLDIQPRIRGVLCLQLSSTWRAVIPPHRRRR